MSVTYSDTVRPAAAQPQSQAYVPVYARAGRAHRNKPVKTWMILAPLGLLVMGGAAALMLTQESAVAPAAVSETPVAPTPAPVSAAGPAAASAPAAVALAPSVSTAPAASTPAAPVERAAPAARAQPARQAAPAAPVMETPVEPTGPRPYVAEAAPTAAAPRVSVTPATPAAAPTPSSPPTVVIAPQG